MMPLLIGFMRSAIAFNDQLRLATVEVSNVVTKLVRLNLNPNNWRFRRSAQSKASAEVSFFRSSRASSFNPEVRYPPRYCLAFLIRLIFFLSLREGRGAGFSADFT